MIDFTKTGLHRETLRRMAAFLEHDEERLESYWRERGDFDGDRRTAALRVGYLEALDAVRKVVDDDALADEWLVP